MQITKSVNGVVTIINPNKSFITSDTVESNLLFAILEKLEEIRCGLVDIEDCLPVTEKKLAKMIDR